MHSSGLIGRPDFVFPKQKVVVFVDGCFWHACPRCGHTPKSNQRYWSPKLLRNRNRDKTVSRQLRRNGWNVLRLWEHEIRDTPTKVITRVKLSIKKN